MTRKRFVKLLMSVGVSRNSANQCAEAARREGKTYECSWSEILGEAVSFIKELIAMATAWETAGVVGAALPRFADAVGDSYGQ